MNLAQSVESFRNHEAISSREISPRVLEPSADLHSNAVRIVLLYTSGQMCRHANFGKSVWMCTHGLK